MDELKNRLRKKFGDKYPLYNKLATIQMELAAGLSSLIAWHTLQSGVNRALEIGTGTGFLTRSLMESFPRAEWYLNDLTDESRHYIEDYIGERNINWLPGDAEKTELPDRLDLVASSSVLQWFDDTLKFLEKVSQSMSPGGLLGIVTYGPENFSETRRVTGKGLNYVSLQAIESTLGDLGYEILHNEDYTRRVYFDIPIDVLYYVRSLGFNMFDPGIWTRKKTEEFCRNYRMLFPPTSTAVYITYHPVIVVARKKG